MSDTRTTAPPFIWWRTHTPPHMWCSFWYVKYVRRGEKSGLSHLIASSSWGAPAFPDISLISQLRSATD